MNPERLVKFLYQGHEQYGRVGPEGQVQVLTGDPFLGYQLTDQVISMKEIKILPPCAPTKIVALGLNYRDHADEFKMEPPDEPLIFLKPASSVIGHGEAILYPPSSQRVDFEAELGVIIGKLCRRVSEAEALAYAAGYTCLNDVTARDLQSKDVQFTRSKSFDTFCPLGPFLVRDIDPDGLAIASFLNGETRQSSNTALMIFKVPFIIHFVSQIMTLYPGDVIATGTPSGVGPMKPGDRIEIHIENIGVLENLVSET